MKITKKILFIIILMGISLICSSVAYNEINAKNLGFKEKDIVRNQSIVQIDDLTICDYLEYCNPTNSEYETRLSSKNEIKSGDVSNEFEEIKVLVTKNITETNCTMKGKEINPKIDCINNTKEITTYEWVKTSEIKLKPKECFEFRKCFTKSAKLDNQEIYTYSPFMSYNLSEYTLLSQSGYNLTVYPNGYSKWNFSDFNDTWGNVQTTNYGATSNAAYPVYNNTGSSSPNSIYCNGISNTINTTDASFQNVFENNFTITGWVKYSAWVDANHYVGARSGSYTDYFHLALFGQGFEAIYFDSGNYNYAYGPSLNGNTAWHFFAISIDTDGKFVLFRVDNYNLTVVGTNVLNPSFDAFSFCGASISSYFANVNLDDIKVYSRNMQWDESQQLFDFGRNDVYVNFTISSGTFNTVNFKYTSRAGKTCADDDINVSASNATTFQGLSGTNKHRFNSQVSGFNLSVNPVDCANVFMNVSNTTLSCDCPTGTNWEIIENCTIIQDCDIRPYNFSCSTGNILNITNGALIRFNNTLNKGFNCSLYIKDTGLKSG